MTKTCRTCGRKRDIRRFYKNKKIADGYDNECVDCSRVRSGGYLNYRQRPEDRLDISATAVIASKREKRLKKLR